MEEIQYKVKNFLLNCVEHIVLHESSATKNHLEHYFIFVAQQDTFNHPIRGILAEYENHYPLADLSASTLNYMKQQRRNYHFIYLDTLDKTEAFFIEKEKFIKDNFSNILSLRILGHPIDRSQHLEANALKYLNQVKEFSICAGLIAKDDILEKMKTGLSLLKEKHESMAKDKQGLGTVLQKKLGSLVEKLK